jgi:hypothetical protein
MRRCTALYLSLHYKMICKLLFQANAAEWFRDISDVAEYLTRRQAETLDPSSRRHGSDSRCRCFEKFLRRR